MAGIPLSMVDCGQSLPGLDSVTRYVPGNQSAVKAPVEANPWRYALPGSLILQVRSLIESLVMVDTENSRGRQRSGSCSSDLWFKEPGRDAGHYHQRAEAMVDRHAGAQREAGNLGVVPLNREGDRRVAQHAEVVGVMRVLPDIFAIDDQEFAKGLLQASMEFIAIAGNQSRQRSRGAG